MPVTWFARTFRFQAFLDDPAAPTGVTSTNGVEVRFGTGAVIER